MQESKIESGKAHLTDDVPYLALESDQDAMLDQQRLEEVTALQG
jgi:hypothetical protein